jgi:hypothetical protein
MNNKEECKGCTILDEAYSCLWFHEDISQCPCSVCLIKVICRRPCDLLDKHISKIRN